MPRTRDHYLSMHSSYALAARLRERGVKYNGQEIRRWNHKTCVAARLWLDLNSAMSWREWMADDEPPPPSYHSWPQNQPKPAQSPPT